MQRLTAATEKRRRSYENALYAKHISHRSLRSDMEDLRVTLSSKRKINKMRLYNKKQIVEQHKQEDLQSFTTFYI